MPELILQVIAGTGFHLSLFISIIISGNWIRFLRQQYTKGVVMPM
ncbi:hypothetical protein [Moorella sp. E306M]|nr:hypothetical protein [Moorella sp. E306M]